MAIRTIRNRRWTIFPAAFVMCGICFASISNAQNSKPRKQPQNPLQILQQKHRDRAIEFSKAIEKLIQDCEEKGLAETAELARTNQIVSDSGPLKLKKLPMQVSPEIPPEITGDERQMRKRLKVLEVEYAKALFLQAKYAVRQGYPSYAFDLVREAVHYDSDNTQARKILGYVRSKNEWVTPFAARQINESKVWHDDFGWLLASRVPKYENGERYYQNRWISAEKEKELRRDFKNAWEVQTDHYVIKTNVGLEKGIELGKALEDFYEVFHETFASFFNSPGQLEKLFEGKVVAGATKQYTVHCYRTKAEYVERMRKYFPSIEQTNGVFLTNDRIAHFFHDPEQHHDDTLFHEATHQLFFESDHRNRAVGDKHHFWIIEGIACYMESFQRTSGTVSLGDLNHIRFRGARRNLLQDEYYLSLREFSGFGTQDFQYAPDRAKYYTQASGLARFFMHYDNGRYREALVNHLSQLYSGDPQVRDRADGLDELTGVDFEELDRQYAEDAREAESKLVRN